jgi:hypothetical protein
MSMNGVKTAIAADAPPLGRANWGIVKNEISGVKKKAVWFRWINI